jgi:TetR/AcrR family transcriptional regulator
MASDADPIDGNPRRRWGGQRALFDDGEAGKLLLEAAGRCIARRGSVRIAMTEVAEEAGVTRSTLYRYFPTRNELVTALLLSRAEGFVSASVAALPDPASAHASLTTMILHAVQSVRGNPITDALFSSESEGQVLAIELESEAIYEIARRHYGPVLARWQAEGQLQPDIDIPTTIRWIIAVSLLLLSMPWRTMSPAERRRFVDAYVVRALLRP